MSPIFATSPQVLAASAGAKSVVASSGVAAAPAVMPGPS